MNSNNTFDDISTQKKDEQRMIKKIKKVVVLNEYEKANKEGFKQKLKLFIDYLNLEKHFDNSTKIAEELFSKKSDVFVLDTLMTIFIDIPVALVSIPLVLGFLVAVTGVNLARLLPYINQNKKLKTELQENGVYDKIVEFLKNNKIEHFELNDHSNDNLYENFINDEIGYGRTR